MLAYGLAVGSEKRYDDSRACHSVYSLVLTIAASCRLAIYSNLEAST